MGSMWMVLVHFGALVYVTSCFSNIFVSKQHDASLLLDTLASYVKFV